MPQPNHCFNNIINNKMKNEADIEEKFTSLFSSWISTTERHSHLRYPHLSCIISLFFSGCNNGTLYPKYLNFEEEGSSPRDMNDWDWKRISCTNKFWLQCHSLADETKDRIDRRNDF